MAEQVNIDILIETAKSAQSVEALKKAYEDLRKAQQGLNKDSEDAKKIEEQLTKERLDLALAAAKEAKNMRELAAAMKELKLLQEQVDQSSPDFGRLAEGINETEGRVGDLNDQFNTLTGSGLERANKSTGLFKEGLNNLDFTKVNIGLKGLAGSINGAADSVKKFKLGDLTKGFKNFSETGIGSVLKSMKQLAVAILSNPITLLATLVVGAVVALISLKENIKFVQVAFDAVGKVVKFFIDGLKALADAMHLTDFAGMESAQNSIDAQKRVSESTQKRYDREIELAKAAGKDTTKLEKEKQYAARATANIQLADYERLRQSGKELTKEQLDDIKALKEARDEASFQLQLIDAKAKAKKEDDDKKAKEDADKKAADAKQKAEQAAKERAADNKRLLKQIQDEQIEAIKDEEKRAVEKAKIDNTRRIEDIKASKASSEIKAQAEKESNAKLQRELDKISKDFRVKREKEAIDATIKFLQDQSALEKIDFDRRIMDAGENARLVYEIRTEQLNTEYATANALAEQAQKKEIADAEGNAAKINEIKEKYRSEEEIRRQEFQLKTDEQNKAERKRLIEEELKDNKDKLDQEIKDIEAGEGLKSFKQKAIVDAKIQALEEEKALRIKLAQETGESIEKINEEFAGKEKDLARERIDAIKAQIEDVLNLADNNIKAVGGAAKAFEELFAQSSQQVIKDTEDQKKSRDDFYKAEIEKAGGNQAAINALNQAKYEEEVALYAEKQKLLDENNKKQKKAFEVNKAASIASAVIDTYKAAQSAYASLSPIPIVGPALGAVAAGVAIAAGLANIAKIKATQFEGASLGSAGPPPVPKGTGGGGSEGGGQIKSAQFFGLGQTKQQAPGTQKVVVVESDITRAQQNVNKIETRAAQTL